MINMKHFVVRTKWLENVGQFYMYAVRDNDTFIPVSDWVSQLFTWDEASFYGSMIVKDSSDTGLYLSPWETFQYFSNHPQSSLIDVQWKEEAEWLHANASLLAEELKDGRFAPDYEAWKQGTTKWKLTDSVVDADFTWLSPIIDEWVKQDPNYEEKWQRLKRTTSKMGDIFISGEQTWLEKIGWTESALPFRIGLRLHEPEGDADDWSIHLFLNPKNAAEEVIDLPVDASRDFSYLPEDWNDEAIRKRLAEELETIEHSAPWLFDENGNIHEQLSEDDAWLFLTETSLTLAELGYEVMLPSWWKEINARKPSLKMAIDPGFGSTQSFVSMNDIVDFNWKLATRDVEFNENEFAQLVEQNRRLVQKNGKWVTLDPHMIKQWQSMMNKVKKEGVLIRDVIEQQMTESAEQNIDQSDDELEIEIELNKHLFKMIQKLKNMTSIPEIEVTEKLHGDLRPYQKQGVEWLLFLRQFGFGACLADDMGLGKTIQLMTYLLQVKEKEEAGAAQVTSATAATAATQVSSASATTVATQTRTPALIICPTSVLGNWQKELERFAPSLHVYTHYGNQRVKGDDFADEVKHADLVVTTYTTATIDSEELLLLDWDSITLDEAQNIKNAQTKQSKAIRNLKARHKIALTGTPIENRLSELWAIFDFLNRGYLGSAMSFRKRFILPIEKDNEQEKIQQIQQLIRPFLLRRTKKDENVSLNLPEKQEQKEYIPLTVEQASLYEQVVQDTFAELAKLTGMKRRGLILAMLTKLKQICNHPALFLDEEGAGKSSFVDRSHKVEKLMELVENIFDHNESSLIFTQYINMGQMLKKVLTENFHTNVQFLHGGLQKQKRDQLIDDFQAGKIKILILSLRAGGTGLNLTEANHVIHYDRWWNPAVENQATDRAYRIGQKRFVHVHKLITTGTLEEKIDVMIEKKKSLSDEIISSENWITELSTGELQELFMLKKG
jgi:SNF2 family DNA or RNA helicase